LFSILSFYFGYGILGLAEKFGEVVYVKRFFAFVLLFASLVTFSGYSDNGFTHSWDEDNGEISLPDSFSLVTSAHQFEEELSFNAPSLFLGDTPQQFRDYLLSNKIDIAMQKEGETLFTTQEINDWVAKYHAIWMNEMSIIYDNLLYILNDDAREFLGYSQVSWERMNDYNSYL